jgi:hypothetical protein
MAQAGYCTQCNSNVWLNRDGSCVNGHPASSVSGAYEAAGAHVQAAPRRSSAPIVIAVVAVVLGGLLLCGILVAIAVPVFLNASDSTHSTTCYANQRLVVEAEQAYLAANPEAAFSGDLTAVMSAVVPEYLTTEPTCPAGGDYYFTDPADFHSLTCSMHRGLP